MNCSFLPLFDNKRKAGLNKKAFELATLWDVLVLLICIDPTNGAVDSWPKDAQQAQDILLRYRSLDPAVRDKKKFDLASFLRGQIGKIKVEIKNSQQLEAWQLDSKMKAVADKIQVLESECRDVVAAESWEQERSIVLWPESPSYGLMDCKLKAVIEMLENDSDCVVTIGSHEQESITTFWQNLIKEEPKPYEDQPQCGYIDYEEGSALDPAAQSDYGLMNYGADYVFEPKSFSAQSECYNYGGQTDFGMDCLFSVPESLIEPFGNDLWMGDGNDFNH